MEESFLLSVPYNGRTHEVTTKFIRLGFIYQFHIGIEDRVLIFERDEERNYKVIDITPNSNRIDKSLLQVIVEKLSSLQD